MTKRIDRSTYLGGQDMAVLVGHNRYRTPRQVWLHKTQGVQTVVTRRMEMGLWAEDLGVQVARADGHAVVRRPDEPVIDGIFGGTPDGEVFAEGARSLWECKTIDADVPEHPRPEWIVQVQHYMGLTGYTSCLITCIGRRWEVRHYVVERDDDQINELRELGQRWWSEHVLGGVEPLPLAPDLPDLLAALDKTKPPVKLDRDEVGSWLRAREAAAKAKATEKLWAAILADRMDGAAVGRCEGFATVKLVAYNKAALDAKRLEAELPEIAKKYRTTYAVRYLSPSLTPNPKGS